MTTADLALRFDPAYEKISRRFHKNPKEFAAAFAKAWFKLTHRDMGPHELGLGPEVPKKAQIWQDPIPAVNHKLVTKGDVRKLKKEILASGLSTEDLVFVAWASASTFRGSDKRGGANGARIRLAPMKDWDANDPARTRKVINKLDKIRKAFNKAQTTGKEISLADMIVLGGCAAVEAAAKAGGHDLDVPFRPGRMDARQSQTDVESFAVLEPTADGFRNYLRDGHAVSAEELLIDKAQLMTLTAPEMTALVGGLRAIGVSDDDMGVMTDRPGVLSNDFFVNLLDMGTEWRSISDDDNVFEGRCRETGASKWKASRVDLVFGSNSELRALSEVYGCKDGNKHLAQDFVNAFVKVMELDRFDLK